MTTETFKDEVQRRLVDTWELMHLINLRSKQGVWRRVEQGQLPPPILVKANIIAFWDRDELAPYLDGGED